MYNYVTTLMILQVMVEGDSDLAKLENLNTPKSFIDGSTFVYLSLYCLPYIYDLFLSEPMQSPPAVVEKLTSFVGKPSINSEIRGKFSGYVAKSTAVTVKLKESNTEPSNAQTFGESCPEEGPSSGQV